MGYTVISLLPFTGIVVYVSNLSLIFINHLEISTREFGFYQAPTIVSAWIKTTVFDSNQKFTKEYF